MLRALSELARETGVRLLLVGGLVRDLRLGLPSRDADFILIGRKARIFLNRVSLRLARRVVTFRKRGIVNRRISVEGRDYDIVELKSGSLERELRRRDFTINAVAFDLSAGRLFDPCRGLDDLAARRIRAVTAGAFLDDPLRMIRAVRLWCELPRFTIARRTQDLIRRDAAMIVRPSSERIREELDRVVLSRQPSRGIALLDRLGLLTVVIPEVEPLRGLAQNRYHHLDAWRHTLAALAAVDDPSCLRRLSRGLRFGPLPGGEQLLVLRWSLLLHDLGKAETRTLGEDGELHFFAHEKRSAALASQIMKRLRFSTRRARSIRRLVELHLRIAVPAGGDLSQKACRRIIRDAGELAPLLVLHSLADKDASHGYRWRSARAKLIRTCREILKLYRSSGKEILAPPRLIDGHDVMRLLGIGPGREVGRILEEVSSRQIAGEISNREQALDLVKEVSPRRSLP